MYPMHRDSMSARDDYHVAKHFISQHVPYPEDQFPDTLADALRSLITTTRITERQRWSKLIKEWSKQLEAIDEMYLAEWLNQLADNIKGGLYELPNMAPPVVDEEESMTILSAEDENDL